MAGFTNYINEIYLKNKNYIVNDEIESPEISVIVPCFNVEKYLEQCLDSLLKQTFKNFEIICIDDGSEDFTSGILIAYSRIDKRVKVIKQENQGPSVARNSGMALARGKYISFVDADDWVDEDYFEKMLGAMKRNNCDISVATIIRKRRYAQKYRVYYRSEKVYESLQSKLEICNLPTCCYIWNKLYKKKLVCERQFKEGAYFEDMLWLPEVLKKANRLVTVPDTNYYYRVNSNSIVKLIPSEKKQNDLYYAQKYVAKFFQENGLHLTKKARTFTKEVKYLWRIPFFRVKEFEGREAYYCFGLKICSKNLSKEGLKTFLVFNTACFGDVLLCNALCQNIKIAFPNSKIVFVVDKPWADVARYQKDVDEVAVFDKNGVHKGLIGILKFVKEFKCGKPFASFVTYKNERNFMIAKLLGSKFVLSQNPTTIGQSMQYRHALLLQNLSSEEIKNLPIQFDLPDSIENFMKSRKYVVLCCVTKKQEKDMPIETMIELVRRLNLNEALEVVLTGVGAKSAMYAAKLAEAGCRFVNLVDKTTILELGAILRDSVGLIGCDTGTMHFGCALNVPTVAVFYDRESVSMWSPDARLYKAVTVDSCQSAENICNAFEELCLGENCRGNKQI